MPDARSKSLPLFLLTCAFAYLALWPFPAQAEDTPSLQHAEFVEQARQNAQAFAAQLKQTLVAAIQAGGLANGIEVCHSRAPEIAAEYSSDGWQLKRVSSKTRNPNNRPDAWERQVLEMFDAQAAAGAAVETLATVEQVDGQYRFIKAINTDAVCLACHGANVSREVEAALAERYPDDRARGYQAGDIRGAVSIRYQPAVD
jgi:hypothetical protein